MILSAFAKRLAASLKAAGGAALIEFNAGTNYAAGTIGAAVRQLFAGPTLTGPLTLPGDAAQALQAVPKQQLDAAIAGIADGQTFTGPVVLPGDAAQALQAVPKQQLDAAVSAAVSAAVPAVSSFGPSVAVAGGTSAGTCTYRVRTGVAQMAGKACAVEIYLDWESHTGSGGLQVHGLPVSPRDSGATVLLFGTLYDGISTKAVFAVTVGPGFPSRVRVMEVGAGLGPAISLPSSGFLRLAGVYLTA